MVGNEWPSRLNWQPMATLVVLTIAGPCDLSALLTAVVRAVAPRRAFVDRPGGHKQHDSPVALGGGIAVMVVVWVPLLAATFTVTACAQGIQPDWMPESICTHIEGIAARLPRLLVIFGGALVLHVVGLIDDVRPLGAGLKFAAQFAVAVFVSLVAEVRLLQVLPAPLSVGLTVLWIVLITNAFNFLDNMDGLSAGVASRRTNLTLLALTDSRQNEPRTPARALFHASGGVSIVCRSGRTRASG